MLLEIMLVVRTLLSATPMSALSDFRLLGLITVFQHAEVQLHVDAVPMKDGV